MVSIGAVLKLLDDRNVDYKYFGSDKLEISGFSTPEEIADNSILWVKDKTRLVEVDLSSYKDLLVVTGEGGHFKEQTNLLVSSNSKAAFFSIVSHFFEEKSNLSEVSPTAVVETQRIGKSVRIGHHCYIGPDVVIGDNVTIKHNVTLENKVVVGEGTTIYSGVVIGSDGYGYYQDEDGNHVRVPHFGGVTIGRDVEIGANTCIDRGTLSDTRIGNNVKIDNLCHIAHNVVIEDNVSVIALSMIAGSAKLQRNSYIAPAAAVMNQLVVGENSIVGMGAVVVRDVPSNVVVAGVPAKILRKLD